MGELFGRTGTWLGLSCLLLLLLPLGLLLFFLPSFGYFCRFSLFLSLYLALVHLASPSRPVVAGNYSMSFCGLRTSDRSERGLWHCYGFSQGAGIRWWKIVSSGRVGGGQMAVFIWLGLSEGRRIFTKRQRMSRQNCDGDCRLWCDVLSSANWNIIE